MSPLENNNSLAELYKIIERLRGPEGCPWDRKQSPESIKKYLLEEAAELAEAISGDDPQHICEEIGDLFFILLMIARIYEEEGHFTTNDAIAGITQKMIRRHPHVFAGKKTGSDNELKKQWDAIKAQENKKI